MTIRFLPGATQRAHRRMKRNGPEARARALEFGMGGAVSYLLKHSPRDTNRYVAAWAMAANEGGLGPFTAPQIRPSRDAEKIEARLSKQYWKWHDEAEEFTQIVRRYEEQGRRDKWYRDAKRKLRKYEKLRDRAGQTLDEFYLAGGLAGSIILIAGRKAGKRGPGLSSLASIRPTFYGGKGERIQAGSRTFIKLTNLEPHARLVERRSKTLKVASIRARKIGVKRVSRKYIDRAMVGVK